MTSRTSPPPPDAIREPTLRAPPLRQRIVTLGILFGIAGIAIALRRASTLMGQYGQR